MSMSRKHFVELARIIAAAQTVTSDDAGDTGEQVRRTIARDVADFCRTQNPNFDRARFLEACGVAS